MQKLFDQPLTKFGELSDGMLLVKVLVGVKLWSIIWTCGLWWKPVGGVWKTLDERTRVIPSFKWLSAGEIHPLGVVATHAWMQSIACPKNDTAYQYNF